MNDEQLLIQRLKARDEAAFVDLIHRHSGYLLRLAGFFTPNVAVAEEVVQEAWMAVLTGIDRFEERSSFKTWISRIVMNMARTRGVRESRMTPFSEFAERETSRPESAVDPALFQRAGADYPDHWSVAPRPWNTDPETQLLESETMAVLNSAVERLPEAQRLVLTMRDIHGWTAEEVCNTLEISETNQRVLLHRARSKVRAILENHYSNSGRTDRDGIDLQGIDRTDHRLSRRALA
ncbi:MAG TPA: sigma-70 family RNA polymerase sigma factor [Terriglobia bacterium]|nr:sigma-70 family RNA polymerase sigma factor [Terriglobia bacterium]